MTAQILRMGKCDVPSTLSRHLIGHHVQGPAPSGIIGRMQSESAVRAYVRRVAKKHPLGDSAKHDDVWQQVEDIAALVPMLSRSVSEFDNYVHTLRLVLCRRGPTRMVYTRAEHDGRLMDIYACGTIVRLRIMEGSQARIITVKTHRDGITRLDDRMVSL